MDNKTYQRVCNKKECDDETFFIKKIGIIKEDKINLGEFGFIWF